MNHNNPAALETVPPISYPTFVLKGKPYQVKFSLGAMYRLEQMGIDPSKLKEEILSLQSAGKNLDLILKLAAASLGTDNAGRFHALGMTPEQLADSIDSQEDFKLLANAVTQALLKVQPAATAQTPAAIPEAPEQLQ